MPHKDLDAKREYDREWRRRQRAEKKATAPRGKIMLIEEAIAQRVITLNPFSTFRVIDPDQKDVDQLILEAARLIQHSQKVEVSKK